MFGYLSTKSDQSLFIKFTTKSVIYILIYVDDILIIGSLECEIDNLVKSLHTVFSLKDPGLLNIIFLVSKC